jgi:hypothetical protein
LTIPDPAADPAADGAERRWRRGAVALAALPAAGALAAEAWVYGDLAGLPLDDPWIHLQFARQLAAGHGLAYHGAELVAGTTAPLWTALLALLAPLPGAPAMWAKLAALAAHLALLLASFGLARRLGLSHRRAALATILVGLSDGLVWAVPSGMEVSLFTALLLAGLSRQIDERADAARSPLAYLLFGLAALLRPEALLLPLLAFADASLRAAPDGQGWRIDGRAARRALVGLALVAVLVVPIGLAFQAMSGSPFPTTLAAKAPGSPRWLPRLLDLLRIGQVLFESQPLLTLLAGGGALVALRRLGTARDRGLLLPLWTVVMPLASALLSSEKKEVELGNLGRYFFPLEACVVLLGLLAFADLDFARVRRIELGRLRLPVGALAVIVLVAVPLARSARMASLLLQSRDNVEKGDGAAAAWLAAHAAPDALLAVVDIGAIGYALPNPLLDLGGILAPERRVLLEEAARAGTPWQEAMLAWIERRRPEYVVVFPGWYPRLDREPGRFPPRLRIRIPGNVVMSRDELVVYATPWTRKEKQP